MHYAALLMKQLQTELKLAYAERRQPLMGDVASRYVSTEVYRGPRRAAYAEQVCYDG